MPIFLRRTILSAIVTVVCLIPLWIFLLAKAAFNPTGFWQNLVLAGLGLWALGGLQFFAAIALLFFLFKIWTDSRWS